MNTKILDCTIRDGGHLNGWNFSAECVKDAYDTAVKSGVDFFEIGYRNANCCEGAGKFYRCDDDFLFSIIDKNEKCPLGMMTDAGKSDLKDFRECRPDLTPVSFVRVAAYPDKLDTAFDLCDGLLEKGYCVFLNLMAVSNFTKNDFNKIKHWTNKSYLESIYFSDSFGSLFPEDIEKYFNILKNAGFEKISFHSHNNLQLAFANTLKALELGFYSVDATAYGIGRGAGNLPAELLLAYLAKTLPQLSSVMRQTPQKYNPVFYFELIEKYFVNFQNQTQRGYTVPHLIAGIKNIHPNYADELAGKNLSYKEIYQTSEIIKEKNLIRYDKNISEKIIGE